MKGRGPSGAARAAKTRFVLLPALLLACLSISHGSSAATILDRARAWFSGDAAPAPPPPPRNNARTLTAFQVRVHFNGECCGGDDSDGGSDGGENRASFSHQLTMPAGTDLHAFKAAAAARFARQLGPTGSFDIDALKLYDEHGLIGEEPNGQAMPAFLARHPSAVKIGSPGPHVWTVPPNALFVWPTREVGHVFRPQNVQSADPARPIELETLSASPRVFRVRNFLSDQEIETLTSFATTKLERSHVGIGNEVFSDDRTSKTAWDTSSDLSMRIQRRGFDLVRVPFAKNQADAVQIIRYGPGQTYIGHTDYFANGYAQTDPSVMPDGTNRFITIFAYLSDVEEGGHTVFPKSRSHPPHMTAKVVGRKKKGQDEALRSVEVAEDGTALSTITGECVGWRQTMACDPDGEREAAGDLGCDERVKNGLSGYCECDGGRRSMEVTCSHSPFTCENACSGRVSDGTTQTGSSFDLFVRECDSGDGLLVSPRKGDALLFYSQTPTAHLDPESYHGGCPVIRGTKWAANVWIWNRKRPVFDGATKAQVDSTEMSMVFLNTRQHYIEVYWIDFSGNDKYFDRVAPQQTYSVNTHLGHKWVIKRGEEVLKRVVASRGMGGAVSV